MATFLFICGMFIHKRVLGWHSKMKKLCWKITPKAVTLFKSEQAATEVSLMQLAIAAGLLPRRRRRKYRNHENKLKTIKEKHEAGDYMLKELLRAYSHWVSL